MSTQAKEYGGESRDRIRFGSGKYYSIYHEIDYPGAQRDHALKLGWANGCPQALALTGPDSKYDLDWMINRYASTNHWYLVALEIARKNNPAVYQWLSTPRLRLLPKEPVGVHESLSVPRSHKWKISQMSGVEGYATPRVLIEVTKTDGGNNNFAAHQVMVNASREAGDMPNTFLAHLADNAAWSGVGQEVILHHVYPRGILDEENCHSIYQNLAQSLKRFAPKTWNLYSQLTAKDKRDLEIADVPITV